MNQIGVQFLMIFGGLFAVVLVGLTFVFLAPAAGSASAGVIATGNEFNNLLPYIGALLAVGAAVAALSLGRKR
jgi:hypothetical protein